MVAVALFICELSQGLNRYLLHKILFSLVSNILTMHVCESVPLLSGRENPLKKKKHAGPAATILLSRHGERET